MTQHQFSFARTTVSSTVFLTVFFTVFFTVLGTGGSACDDAAGKCSVNGVSHRVGETFPDSDGCNSCSCTAAGTVACTTIGCLGDAGLSVDQSVDRVADQAGDHAVDHAGDGAACDFSSSYEYGPIGGDAAYVIRSFLSPGNQYRHTRMGLLTDASAALSCAPEMPPCGALDVITAYDVEVHDLPLADVQNALAQSTPPLYGRDQRPVDGTVFEFKRADGRGFLVGDSCAGAPVSSCTPIPAGIAQIKQRLLDLDAQQLAAPACQSLRIP